MVSVRKSHQISAPNFEQWLASLSLTEAKNKALLQVWQKVAPVIAENNTKAGDKQLRPCQTKALEMVEILSELNLDKESLMAAFLCPLIQYKYIDIEFVQTHFSKAVVQLCEGVIQMEAIKALQHSGNDKVAANQVDNIRKMLLAMVEDVRAVVIKLAERICNLRQVKDSDEEVRVLAAKETQNIYAPLANRLGIGQLKWELEDISFRYLHPDIYKKIAKQLAEKRLEREQYMANFVSTLEQQLAKLEVKGEVFGRPKHIYSIYKKMQKKHLDFDQLFDVRAVRIIVDKLQDCYTALGIVHTTWKHLPSEFDDYIATPKANGYQSIHTVVLGPQGKAVEVQIRTKQMDEDAELGVAAHWRYKEGNGQGKSSDKQRSFDDKVSWLRKILQWQDDVSENGQLLDELRSQVFEDRIYVFTPNGDVIDLPSGSTPLDFAYYIHSNVGHCCIGAKVSGRIVPFTYKLHTGDQVEVLTSKTPNPSRDWLNPSLNYLHTARARAKVQHFFKLLDRDKHVALGKEALDHELSKLPQNKIDLIPIVERFNFTQLEDLYAAIGGGHVKLQQVVNAIQQQTEKLHPQQELDPQSIITQPAQNQKLSADNNGITVSGVGNLLTHLAKCCQPVLGDEIDGFITQGRGISVHRKDCEQLANALSQHPERQVDVQWGGQDKQGYIVSIQIISTDRQGLLRDVSTIIANERLSIYGIESNNDTKRQTTSMTIKLAVHNSDMLTKLINKISQLDDIIEVKRL
jgi:GTP pyrophosphokinase